MIESILSVINYLLNLIDVIRNLQENDPDFIEENSLNTSLNNW